jgi:hypothetical protein
MWFFCLIEIVKLVQLCGSLIHEYNYTRVIYRRADFTTFCPYELRTFCENILVLWTMDDNEFTWTRQNPQTPQISSGGGFMASTDESRMYGEFKNYKIYWRILIDNCRNLQDLLGAFIYPISTGAYQSFQEIDLTDSLMVSMPW